MDRLEELAERFAFRCSTKQVRECVRSLLSGEDDWRFKPTEAHRTRPYPMGFYADDHNLYYALGWGYSWPMWPWERWLVRRAAALRASTRKDRDDG